MKAILLRLSVLSAAVVVVLAQTGQDARDLQTELFVTNGYDKKVLPLTDQSKTVEVYVNFYLLAINGLDEVTETLKTTGYLWVAWTDEFLVWDPSLHGGLNYYLWPQNDLWVPDVTLRNSILEYKELGASNLKIQVQNDGLVSWFPFQVVSAINKKLHNVNFPTSPEELSQVKVDFYKISKFPNVIGAVDGTLIHIAAPSIDENIYICRKGYHAVNIQAVVDCKLRFTNITAKWPGSTHDSTVFENSSIKPWLEGTKPGWLLGDSGYPLKPYLITPKVFQSTCSVDITYFPFDIQTCHLIFVAWSYTSAEIVMYGGSAGINLEQYEESSLWEVVGSSWTSELKSGEAAIKFTIKMKRKPLYFILSVIMPILMLAVLNVFVFTLPCESGERAGYAITVFLALAVFLTIVADSLPANSETTAIFAIYVIIQTLQSTFSTLFALLTIRLSTKETEVPSYLVKITRFIQYLQCKRPKRTSRVKPEHADAKTCPKAMFKSDNTTESKYPEESKVDITETAKDTHDEPEPRDKVTWPTVVRAIDCVLFVFFLISLLVSSIVCFVVTGTSN